MGYIYTETYNDNKNKKILVLNPRDALIRKLNTSNQSWFGTSSLMIGAIVGACGLSSESSSISDETLPSATYNYFSLGIKNTVDLNQPSNEPIPFQSGCSYCGITTSISSFTTALSGGAFSSLLGFANQGPTGSFSFTTSGGALSNFNLPVSGARFLGVKYSHALHDPYSSYNPVTNPRVPLVSAQYSGVRYDIRSDNIDAILSQYLNGSGTMSPGEFSLAGSSPAASANNFINMNDVSFFMRWPFFNSKLKVYGYGWAIL